MFNNTDKRLTILEAKFEQFESRLGIHMDNEGKIFDELKKTLISIETKIEDSKNNNERFVDKIKTELLNHINEQYSSKLEVQKMLTETRVSIIKDIREEKRRSVRELWLLITGFTSCLLLSAWIYINVIKQ